MLGAFFCNFMTPKPGGARRIAEAMARAATLRLVSRNGARSAARPRTRSCGFKASEAIPLPGPDAIFSGRCGAICRRLCPQPLAPRDDERLALHLAGGGIGDPALSDPALVAADVRNRSVLGVRRARLPRRPRARRRGRNREARAARLRRDLRGPRPCGSSRFQSASRRRRRSRKFSRFVRFQGFAARKISPPARFPPHAQRDAS